MKILSKNQVKLIVSGYLISLFAMGQIYSGILFADLFLPLFLWLFSLKLNKLDPGLKVIFLIMIAYSIIVSVLNIMIGNNSATMAFILILRFLAFCLMLVFSCLYHKEIMLGIRMALPIILILVTYVTLINYFNGQKAYYSFVQIPSTWSPAASGFTLSALGFYAFTMGIYQDNNSMSNIRFGFFFMALGLLTFTNSPFGALLISVLILIIFKIIFSGKDGKKSIYYFVLMLALSVASMVFYEQILDFFWRAQWMLFNLEFRLDKVAGIKEDMCNNALCKFFGTSPGSHSFFSNAAWGQTTILAFDQLQGRILVEWGWLGAFLWALLMLKLIFIKAWTISQPIFLFVVFGFLFGIGSEFIFENYSGQLYGLLLGTLVGQHNFKQAV
jgi:hypothetical protein